MAHLERGDEVEPLGLRLDGIDDGTLPMTGIDAPQARHCVENAPAI
jgi:hypothetical protein